MATIHELWRAEDLEALRAFREAMKSDNLMAGLLSIEGAGEEEKNFVDRELTRIADSLASVRGESDSLRIAGELVRVLADEEGFAGDTEDYYAIRNSMLSVVMKRKRGLPILLSAVWIMVGQRVGVDVKGIGLPGHFIVRVGDSDLYLDPFSRGALLSRADCKRLVRELCDGEVPWKDTFLEPVSAAQLFDRVLSNINQDFVAAQDDVQVYRTLRFQGEIPSERQAAVMLAVGMRAEDFGDFVAARESYVRVLDEFPDGDEARLAEARIAGLGDGSEPEH